jgi:uncharacterized lipoprotein YmbA
MTRSLFAIIALFAVTLPGAGCSVLAPRPNLARHYFLSADAAAQRTNAEAGQIDSTVGLGPLKLADYLNRAERAVRVGPNQIRFMENEYWAESLDANILSVLSQNLTARLGPARVVTLPTSLGGHRTYDVPLEILRFESTPKGDAELHARWEVKDTQAAELLLTTETHITEPAQSADPGAAVAALSRALSRWSEEIAAALERLRATSARGRPAGLLGQSRPTPTASE